MAAALGPCSALAGPKLFIPGAALKTGRSRPGEIGPLPPPARLKPPIYGPLRPPAPNLPEGALDAAPPACYAGCQLKTSEVFFCL